MIYSEVGGAGLLYLWLLWLGMGPRTKFTRPSLEVISIIWGGGQGERIGKRGLTKMHLNENEYVIS